MSPVARGASPFYIEKFKRKVLVHKWIGSRIHLKMQMRNGRVARVAYCSNYIALPCGVRRLK